MSQPWTALFMINGQAVMEKNLTDVTQSQADHSPAANVNSIMWVLTHILEARRWLLRVVLNPNGSSKAIEPMTLGQIKEAMNETQEAMAEAFDAVIDWNEQRIHPLFQTPAPLDQIVGTFFMHEAYHLGQLGTARKLLGMPGALQAPQPLKVQPDRSLSL